MSNKIIRNVEFNFAHVFKSHSPFGQDIWDVQLRTTDVATKDELVAAGVSMKQHADGYWHANVKRPVLTRKGDKNKPVQVLDAAKNPWDPDVAIGNGSTGNVKLFTYDYNVGGRSGTSCQLVAMQVVNLVEYKGANDVDFDDETDGSNAEDF